jgi:hypothetical protein
MHVEAIKDEESNSDSDEEDDGAGGGGAGDGIHRIEKEVLYALNLAGHVSDTSCNPNTCQACCSHSNHLSFRAHTQLLLSLQIS